MKRARSWSEGSGQLPPPDPPSAGGSLDRELIGQLRSPCAVIVGRMSANERYKGHDILLDAWPDVPGGLARLRTRFLLAPLSNGNISLQVDLARRNQLPWDAILGAEVAGDYKPKPRVYLSACEAFDLQPVECMMVAAHTNDLLSAAKCGLRTAHIARPNEHGTGKGEARPQATVDFAAAGLEDLASKLTL